MTDEGKGTQFEMDFPVGRRHADKSVTDVDEDGLVKEKGKAIPVIDYQQHVPDLAIDILAEASLTILGTMTRRKYVRCSRRQKR